MARFALTLVIIGALNWLLIGLFQWDLISALLGGDSHRVSSGLSRIIYTLIGLCGIYCVRFYSADRQAVR